MPEETAADMETGESIGGGDTAVEAFARWCELTVLVFHEAAAAEDEGGGIAMDYRRRTWERSE